MQRVYQNGQVLNRTFCAFESVGGEMLSLVELYQLTSSENL